MGFSEYLQSFIERNRLPLSYLEAAQEWYDPLCLAIAGKKRENQPLLVAINGCQGSGKTTLSDYLAVKLRHEFNFTVTVISIDDFYLTRTERRELSERVHPLFMTRGVPGTHDIELANRVLDQLTGEPGEVELPSFDKAADDRRPEEDWVSVPTPVDVVILEGWCMGVTPADHIQPACNDLEQNEDPDGVWRAYVNDSIKRQYLELFERFDLWFMLRAPGFHQVFEWRLQQEQKLLESEREKGSTTGSKIMSEKSIARFVQHYQRLTENCLNHLPEKCHFVFELDKSRQPITVSNPLKMAQNAHFSRSKEG